MTPHPDRELQKQILRLLERHEMTRDQLMVRAHVAAPGRRPGDCCEAISYLVHIGLVRQGSNGLMGLNLRGVKA